jgi:hypothetical protein
MAAETNQKMDGRSTVKIVTTVKKPFGKAKYSPVKHARYLDWEDAFDVEFDDGLCILEPHATFAAQTKLRQKQSLNRVRSKIGPVAVFLSIPTTPKAFGEVSWSFVRELPPKISRK